MTDQSDEAADRPPTGNAADRVPPPGPWPRQTDPTQPAWTASGGPTGPAWGSASAGASDSAGAWSASSDRFAAGIERPEIVIGAAFVGGLLLAMLVRRLAR